MGPFEMVVALVLITTIGKMFTRRGPRHPPKAELSPGAKEELESIRESMHGLSGRLERLEQERDFYKDLLEAPDERRGLSSPSPEMPPHSTESRKEEASSS